MSAPGHLQRSRIAKDHKCRSLPLSCSIGASAHDDGPLRAANISGAYVLSLGPGHPLNETHVIAPGDEDYDSPNSSQPHTMRTLLRRTELLALLRALERLARAYRLDRPGPCVHLVISSRFLAQVWWDLIPEWERNGWPGAPGLEAKPSRLVVGGAASATSEASAPASASAGAPTTRLPAMRPPSTHEKDGRMRSYSRSRLASPDDDAASSRGRVRRERALSGVSTRSFALSAAGEDEERDAIVSSLLNRRGRLLDQDVLVAIADWRKRFEKRELTGRGEFYLYLTTRSDNPADEAAAAAVKSAALPGQSVRSRSRSRARSFVAARSSRDDVLAGADSPRSGGAASPASATSASSFRGLPSLQDIFAGIANEDGDGDEGADRKTEGTRAAEGNLHDARRAQLERAEVERRLNPDAVAAVGALGASREASAAVGDGQERERAADEDGAPGAAKEDEPLTAAPKATVQRAHQLSTSDGSTLVTSTGGSQLSPSSAGANGKGASPEAAASQRKGGAKRRSLLYWVRRASSKGDDEAKKRSSAEAKAATAAAAAAAALAAAEQEAEAQRKEREREAEEKRRAERRLEEQRRRFDEEARRRAEAAERKAMGEKEQLWSHLQAVAARAGKTAQEEARKRRQSQETWRNSTSRISFQVEGPSAAQRKQQGLAAQRNDGVSRSVDQLRSSATTPTLSVLVADADKDAAPPARRTKRRSLMSRLLRT